MKTKTEHELFTDLKYAVDAVSAEEAQLKQPLEEEYTAFCQPFVEEFAEATKAQRTKAESLLQPARDELELFKSSQYAEFIKSILPYTHRFEAEIKALFPNGQPDLSSLTPFERESLIKAGELRNELDFQMGAEARRCERPYEAKLNEYKTFEKKIEEQFTKETKFESAAFDLSTAQIRSRIDKKFAEIDIQTEQRIAELQEKYNIECAKLEGNV